MTYLILGAGLQGRAAIYGLHTLDPDAKVIVGDLSTEAARVFVDTVKIPAPMFVEMDASDADGVKKWMKQADVVIDLLPIAFTEVMAEIAVEAGTHLVNTFYPGKIGSFHERAIEKGVSILPEMGMDPGIDLVMANRLLGEFDEVMTFYSYGAGVPEREACDNILNYKISWTWAGVLDSYIRPARFIKNGRMASLEPAEVFEAGNLHLVTLPELGTLEAIPNGNALNYIDILGLKRETLKAMGRYSFRWPGHAAHILSWHRLGLLEKAPSPKLGFSPFEFLVKHFEPRLQYRDGERDLGIVVVSASGNKNGESLTITDILIDRRDLKTGLYAMNRMVGFSAAVTARMIARGDITARGVLSPARDVPVEPFLDALAGFGMAIQRHSGLLNS